MTSPLIDHLANQSRCHHDELAIIDGKRTVTFLELETLTKRWAARFEDLGIGTQDPVLVFVPPSIDLYAILLALWWRGAVAVFADAWTTRNRMSIVTEQVQPKLFVAIPKALILRAAAPALHDVPTEILWPWHRLPPASEAPSPTPVEAKQSALVTFTTGSSGTPKGADRTHGFLIAQHRALDDALGEIPRGPELVTLPIFGLHALASGRTCQLAPISHAKPSRYDPKRMLRDIRRHRPSSAAASPAVYETLVRHLERSGARLEEGMHLHVGGAAVTPSFMARMRQVFPNAVLTAVYGSTEAEPIALLDGDTLAAHEEQTGWARGLPVGKPYRGIRVQIIAAGQQVFSECTSERWQRIAANVGEIGEICVAGDHVLTRYYHSSTQQSTDRDWQKVRVGETVWHRTGDAGSWQSDGCLSLHGTVAQSFEWAGRHWYPFPFELQLATLPEVKKATLVCAAGGPVVCVEPRGSVTKQAVKASIATLELPFDWSLWLGRIPRDPRHNSKVDHHRLRVLARTST